MPLLEVQHLQKIYTTRFGGNQVQALTEKLEAKRLEYRRWR